MEVFLNFIPKALFMMVLFSVTSCVSTFSDLQSARLLDRGESEFTPFVSFTYLEHDDEYEKVQNHFGVQGGMGVGDSLNLLARYEYILIEDAEDDFAVNVIALGPKFSLIDNS